MKKDTTLLIRINSEIKEEVQKIAEANDTTISGIVNDYLYKLAYTQEGLSIDSLLKVEKMRYKVILEYFKSGKQSCEKYPTLNGGERDLLLDAIRFDHLKVVVNLGKMKDRFINKSCLKILNESTKIMNSSIDGSKKFDFDIFNEEFNTNIPMMINNLRAFEQ